MYVVKLKLTLKSTKIGIKKYDNLILTIYKTIIIGFLL